MRLVRLLCCPVAALILASSASPARAQTIDLVTQDGFRYRVTLPPNEEPELQQWRAVELLTYFNRVGSVTSEGDAVLNADAARSEFLVDGTGVRIGVISDSYAQQSAIQGSFVIDNQILAGDLPGPGNPNGFTTPVTVVRDDISVDPNTDEGRAMLEIIHDIAPGAELLFHSAFNNTNFQPNPPGDISLAIAIDNLVAAGCDIIVDDVGFLTAPFFQTGAAAQAVNRAFDAGVAYFSAAGNSGTEAYQATFNGPAGGLHNYDADNDEPASTDTFLRVTVQPGRVAIFVLQWSDAFGSLGTGGFQADYDLDVVAVNGNAGTPIPGTASQRRQSSGLDAWELTGVINNGQTPGVVGVRVRHVTGELDELIKILVFSAAISDDDDTNSPTVWGHPAAAGGLGVAAAFALTPNVVESFSSAGPALLLFSASGAAIGPLNSTGNPTGVLVQAPQITAPDGVSTTTNTTSIGGVNFAPFFGTSAAAPHAAAVAALLKQQASKSGSPLTVEQLYEVLLATAVDIGPPGFDTRAGAGRIDANAALLAVSRLSEGQPPELITVISRKVHQP